MENIDQYREMPHSVMKRQNILISYYALFTGERKTLPRGTWSEDKNVIIIMRYVLEIKMQLTKSEIPKINKKFIAEQKLWGALNRFKSIKRLLNFVYLNEFGTFDFVRVPKGYWENRNHIKHRLEYYLEYYMDKNNYTINDIPTVVTCDQLIEWGFSNPLKRYNDSPYTLINALYPGKFNQYDFRKLPQGSANSKTIVTKQFVKMLEKENIKVHEIPKKVTQEMLNLHRLNGTLSHFNNSPSELIKYLFPNQFDSNEFIKKNRYWQDESNVRKAISNIIKKYNIPHEKIPQTITKDFLRKTI